MSAPFEPIVESLLRHSLGSTAFTAAAREASAAEIEEALRQLDRQREIAEEVRAELAAERRGIEDS
jgi:hypothetical protein